MKRFLLTGLLLGSLMIGWHGNAAALNLSTQDPLRITINGAPLMPPADQQPFIQDGRVLVPLRSLLVAMDAAVTWDAASRTVHASKDAHKLELAIDRNIALVDNRQVQLDVPARIINGRTFVPLRLVAEALGGQAFWDQQTRTAKLLTSLTPISLPKSAGENPWSAWSPWSQAQLTAVWYHGGKLLAVPEPSAALKATLGGKRLTARKQVWATYLDTISKDADQDGRMDTFYISVAVTIEEMNGKLRTEGTDVIEVKTLPGIGDTVTAFAHHQSPPAPAELVEVWYRTDGGMIKESLAAPAMEILAAGKGTGRYRIPLDSLKRIGTIATTPSAPSATIRLAGGKTITLPITRLHETAYVDVDQVVKAFAALTVTLPNADSTVRYEAVWNETHRQLVIQLQQQHRSS